MLTINNTFSRRDIVFTCDFCNNHSHPASPASLYLTSLRPRPTRPRVPYLMSSSPSSRVTTSQVPTHVSRCPRPLVPVPLLYTALEHRTHVRKSRMSLNFTFNLNNLYLASILFTWLKFTSVNVHSQKRVSGNQPLSTVSKHLLLGLPLKICRTK